MFLSQDIKRGPADDFWYEPVGTITAAGMRVSPETAMRLTVVYACVRVAAETVGHLPLHLYRRLPNGGKERAVRHPLYRLLHDVPNAWQTSMEWAEMMQGHLELRGNAYSEIIFGRNGRIQALIPLNPDRMGVEMLNESGSFRYVYKRKDGSDRPLERHEVLHFRGMSSDGFMGISPIEYERESVGEALAAQEYGSTFYRNGATMPGWIEFPQHFKDDETKRKFRTSWQEAQTGSNRFKTPVLELGMKYHELGLKHTDAQFLETRKHKDSELARIYRIPPHKVGILDKATFSNIEQQAIEFVTDSMMPRLRRLEQALNRDLLTEGEQEEYFFEFAVEGLLRGDAKARADFYNKGIQDGWMTRNEVRIKENMNPLPGLDTPLQPLNMAPAGQKRDRADALAHAAANRIVSKELAAARKALQRGDDMAVWAADFFGGKHVAMVVSMLAVHGALADAYVQSSREQAINYAANIEPLLADWEQNKAAQLAALGD